MKIYQGTMAFAAERETAVILGKFDGLHLGHERLITEVLKRKERGLLSCAFTFDVPPGSVVEGTSPRFLSTREEKEELFEAAGLDLVVECPFTEEVRRMVAEDFLRMLSERLLARCIVIGADCRFGYGRAGDKSLLLREAEALSYEAVVVDKETWQGREISSSWIREEIRSGNLETAERLLGHAYFFSGEVVHGNQIGRKIQTPTLNLSPQEGKVLPPFGVYVTETRVEGEIYQGISNLGVKPTVSGDGTVGLETHLFSFAGDIYGKRVRTSFLKFLRPERKFASLEALQAQIREDQWRAEQFLLQRG